MPRSLYIIDGHAQIYRAYYAPFGNLTSPSGEPTRATHVFFQMLLNLIHDRKPDYLMVVLDGPENKLRRKQVYPEYKAHREPPPEDLPVQEDRIISILRAMQMPMLCIEGCEADDVMATMATRLAADDLHVYLVSRDKDLDQVLSERVSIFDPLKNEVITPERLFQIKGWRPEQAIDAQTLTGDSVDNVPGVVGIGPKTAAKLLAKYGSVQGVVEHADELTPKQRENVLAFAAQLPITRQLVTLQTDVELDFELESAACARMRWSAARPIFEQLGFRRLPDQLPIESAEATRAADAGAPAHTPKTLLNTGDEPRTARAPQVNETGGGRRDHTPHASAATPDFAEVDHARSSSTFQMPSGQPVGQAAITASAALREPDQTRWRLINTPDAFEAFAAALEAQREFAVDTETTGVNPIDAELVGMSFAWDVGSGYYIPVMSMYGGALPIELVRSRLAPILADESKTKVGHNLKYDLIVLRLAGMPVRGPLFDTMIAAFAVDPMRNSFGLDPLAHAYFGHSMIPIGDLIGKGRDQLRMDQVPLDHVAEYAAEDADYTWRLRQLIGPLLGPAQVDRLFFETEMPLVNVLTEMEFNGICIDVEFLRALGEKLARRTNELVDQAHRLVGGQFNLDSPKQLAEILFDKLNFRVIKRTKTARSTDAETLEILAEETQHPLLALLLEHRELQKLRGTYIDALPNDLSRRTGRVHTSFHQTGAITGRLSSSEPNLQNIPIRTPLGREIRRAFVPRSADEVLIVADYSQVELRVLAHYCEDEELIRAFADDRDIHAFVAAQVNNVPIEQVTKEMRSRAKAVNFGIIYGQTAHGLARGTGMSRTDAQAFIDDYFRRYPRVKQYISRCIADARRDGFVRTILGRRRPLRDMDSRNAAARAQAERLAVNTVMQGSAADLIKTAMVRLDARIRAERLPLRMLLQVHDELVCEGPRAEADRFGRIIAETMSGAIPLRVPLKVAVAFGENWLEAK